MATARKRPAKKAPKQVTRYTHDAHDPVTPETGHTDRLVDEEVVTLEMDNGWSDALEVTKLDTDKTVVVDMDPAVDPVLLWAGKRNRRAVPVLPLQRNEIVPESRIARIIERARAGASGASAQGSFFADLEREFRESGKEKRVEFYTHDEAWRNKLICGDSLEVMESLLKYERLAGQVQMVYMDPPYGIGYNSNFQQRVDTNENDDKDLADDVLTIRAFNDCWSLGVHSYASYITERLYLCRELLAPSGSLFLQCNAVHMHRLRMILDEVLGASNFLSVIHWKKAAPEAQILRNNVNYLLWYAKDRDTAARRTNKLFRDRRVSDGSTEDAAKLALWGDFPGQSSRTLTSAEKRELVPLPGGTRIFRVDKLTNSGTKGNSEPVEFEGELVPPQKGQIWKKDADGMAKLVAADRVIRTETGLSLKFYLDDNPVIEIGNLWEDTAGKIPDMVYAVQTNEKIIDRCICLATQPGDLVLDPTSGGGTTAVSAERLGRRWVAIDNSRVAINVSRRRLLSKTFPQYVLKGAAPAAGFDYETASRLTPATIVDQLEPEQIDRVDRPLIDSSAVRVHGPFEVMTLGRYSRDDWQGSLVDNDIGRQKLGNYVEVVCRLYEPEIDLGIGDGFIHGLAAYGNRTFAVSVGPLTGRVTASQLSDAAKEAANLGIPAVHMLGWAFEANVGEVKRQLELAHKVEIELVMIRPDALAEGLKTTQRDTLFSPLALPEVSAERTKADDTVWRVILDGVTVFDRKTRSVAYHPAEDKYVAAWYLDEDYDGDCFVDCQMFFDFKKAPNLKTAAGVEVDAEEFDIRFTSDAFPAGRFERIAVKVVDVFGNESTMVRDIS